MPRGVKGSGPQSKVKQKDANDDTLEREFAADPRVPTCRIDGAVLESGGRCNACQQRALRFKELMRREAEGSRCDTCGAPASRLGRRGGSLTCKICRKLLAREKALGITPGASR